MAATLVALVLTEGYSDKAIIPVPGDRPTIGFGSTFREDGSAVQMGDKTTPPLALARAFKDVQAYEGAVKKCVKVPLHQWEYDAYIDHAYNIGTGAFCSSTLVKKLNAEDYDGACKEILVWYRFNGFDCRTPGNKVCSGLWTRRLADYKTCIGPVDEGK
jgi:lysozyme